MRCSLAGIVAGTRGWSPLRGIVKILLGCHWQSEIFHRRLYRRWPVGKIYWNAISQVCSIKFKFSSTIMPTKMFTRVLYFVISWAFKQKKHWLMECFFTWNCHKIRFFIRVQWHSINRQSQVNFKEIVVYCLKEPIYIISRTKHIGVLDKLDEL